jgi:hypothetical protein
MGAGLGENDEGRRQSSPNLARLQTKRAATDQPPPVEATAISSTGIHCTRKDSIMETSTLIIVAEIRHQPSQTFLILAFALALTAFGLFLDIALASSVTGQIALGPVAVALGMVLAVAAQEVRYEK